MARGIFKLIEVASSSLSIEQAFLEDLKMSISKSEDSYVPSRFYKPSSMLCIRNMYYQRSGKSTDVRVLQASFKGILESGTDRHERIQKAISDMKKNGFDCEYIDVETFVKENNLTHIKIISKSGMETKCLNTKYSISFLADGIIKYKNKYYILEIKTEISSKFWNRTDAEDSHKTQATAYSLSFNINETIFLYENRDTCDKKSFLVVVTDDMKLDRVVGKIEECEGYLKRGIIPPKCDNKKACKYCNYVNSCREDG